MPEPTIPAAITRDPRRLADYLSAHGMPGGRSAHAITKLRRDRARLRLMPVEAVSVEQRARDLFRTRAVLEIARRGGETVIEDRSRRVGLTVLERADGIALVGASGWRYYSSRTKPRYVTLAYLYGQDDAGPWAARVPGSVVSVAEGLAWLTPAAVARAREDGRRVRRQGDVYAVETTSRRDGRGEEDLPLAHLWRPQTRRLVHRPADGRKHRPLVLPWAVEFFTQRTVAMGRGNGWADGD